MSVVANARQQVITPIQNTPPKISRRGSTRAASPAAAGATNSANSPVHAVTRPASVAV